MRGYGRCIVDDCPGDLPHAHDRQQVCRISEVCNDVADVVDANQVPYAANGELGRDWEGRDALAVAVPTTLR